MGQGTQGMDPPTLQAQAKRAETKRVRPGLTHLLNHTEMVPAPAGSPVYSQSASPASGLSKKTCNNAVTIDATLKNTS